jgi:hypothetical protein
VLHLHQAISKYGAWEHMKEEPEAGKGYMWQNPEWQTKIERDPLVMNDGHSCYTLAFCFRLCQFIAQNGWRAFQDNFTPSVVQPQQQQ